MINERKWKKNDRLTTLLMWRGYLVILSHYYYLFCWRVHISQKRRSCVTHLCGGQKGSTNKECQCISMKTHNHLNGYVNKTGGLNVWKEIERLRKIGDLEENQGSYIQEKGLGVRGLRKWTEKKSIFGDFDKRCNDRQICCKNLRKYQKNVILKESTQNLWYKILIFFFGSVILRNKCSIDYNIRLIFVIWPYN